MTPSDDLRRTLKKAVRLVSAENGVDTIHSLLPPSSSDGKGHDQENRLYLSLSRPLILQTNQRNELRAALGSLASKTKR